MAINKAATASKARALYRSGKSIRVIAQRLNMSKSAVYRAVHNRLQAGQMGHLINLSVTSSEETLFYVRQGKTCVFYLFPANYTGIEERVENAIKGLGIASSQFYALILDSPIGAGYAELSTSIVHKFYGINARANLAWMTTADPITAEELMNWLATNPLSGGK